MHGLAIRLESALLDVVLLVRHGCERSPDGERGWPDRRYRRLARRASAAGLQAGPMRVAGAGVLRLGRMPGAESVEDGDDLGDLVDEDRHGN